MTQSRIEKEKARPWSRVHAYSLFFLFVNLVSRRIGTALIDHTRTVAISVLAQTGASSVYFGPQFFILFYFFFYLFGCLFSQAWTVALVMLTDKTG